MVNIQDYRALTSASPRPTVHSVLTSLGNGLYSDRDRQEVVRLLLSDIEKPGPKSRLTNEDLPVALIAVKTLCRHPAASSLIVEQNVAITSSDLQLCSVLIAVQNLATLHRCLSISPKVALEAERCVANGLLLHEDGRERWVALGGGTDAISRLKARPSAEECFVVSRILFLITLKASPFMKTSVDELGMVEAVVDNLKRATVFAQERQLFGQEALIDLLKVLFNLIVHSSPSKPGNSNAMAEDKWDARFDPAVAPLMRLLLDLPPTSPSPLQSPLTYVLHNLLYVPADGVNTDVWVFFHTDKSQQETPLTRLWTLCERVLKYYIEYDPDDPDVRAKCRAEGVVLDELAVPLPIILGKIAKESADARTWAKSRLIPPDLDRSTALEKQHSFLGTCLRVMTCVHHPHLKETVGEMLYAVCNENASDMAGLFGYGNVAGFLFSKGVTAAPSEQVDADGKPINPISGMTAQPGDATLDEMTEEEKEQEAERLFVLFDRLERTGMGVNPVRQAYQEGRLG